MHKTLYKRSKAGKISEWSISSGTDGICIRHGFQDGKKQCDMIVVEGKHKGKSNETTPEQQAENEAESKVKKQLDSGYKESIDEIDDMFLLPMLAQDYTKGKNKEKIIFPCYVQPKIDGVRCMISVQNGELKAFTRKGKPFTGIDHITSALSKTDLAITENFALDGELFSDKMTFQKLAGLIRKKKLTKGDLLKLKDVYLILFDCVFMDTPETPFNRRYATLQSMLLDECEHVQILKTKTCGNEKQLAKFHQQLSQKYEGTIIRNIDSPYGINTRSYDLQKLKDFHDEEYIIAGHKEGAGRDAGTVIWNVLVPHNPKDNVRLRDNFKAGNAIGGRYCSVRPRGSVESRKAMFNDAESYYGKLLTVRYQELTDDGIPRFPVGISIRDYE